MNRQPYEAKMSERRIVNGHCSYGGKQGARIDSAHCHIDGASRCEEQIALYPELLAPRDSIHWRLSFADRPRRRVVYGKRTKTHIFRRVVGSSQEAHQIVREFLPDRVSMERTEEEPTDSFVEICCQKPTCAKCGKKRGMTRLSSICAPCRDALDAERRAAREAAP